MEVGIEAEIFTQKHMNKNTNYTMNHIQVMTVKCGRVETDQTLKIHEMTRERTKCQF